MEIEIKPHVGRSRRGNEIDQGQDIVFADGVQVGYMGREPGAWLACIVAMDEDTRQELEAAINRYKGEPIGGVAVPPEPEVVEQDEDDELDDYED